MKPVNEDEASPARNVPICAWGWRSAVEEKWNGIEVLGLRPRSLNSREMITSRGRY